MNEDYYRNKCLEVWDELKELVNKDRRYFELYMWTNEELTFYHTEEGYKMVYDKVVNELKQLKIENL
jgi:hypothetical protein